MYERTSQLEFIEDGKLQSIMANVSKLTNELGKEILHTAEGKRILLEDLISMNGVAWKV